MLYKYVIHDLHKTPWMPIFGAEKNTRDLCAYHAPSPGWVADRAPVDLGITYTGICHSIAITKNDEI